MKFFKKSMCVFLAALMMFSCLSVASAETAPAEAEVTGFTQEDMLKTKGTKIVNQKGEKITLKGVNLGAWLVREDWLCPDHVPTELDGIKTKYDGEYVYDTLQKRFGIEAAQELLEIYYDNWITEYDLDNIKEMGFNCVRVPFWYRNFYHDDKGTKILDDNGEWDFHYLDWVVEECSKRELYVILDMHGAVGSQSDAPHSGRGFAGVQLMEDSERGEEYRRLTDELWAAIASRFVGNPAVAMYDLLNEPMCDAGGTEIDNRLKNEAIYTRLYNTVRAVDSDHIITVEAIWTALALPHAFLKGWTNVVYQMHFYQKSDFIFAAFCVLTRMWHFDVPLMMGEFYPHKLNDYISANWASCFRTMNDLGIHWMLWTYKATGHGMWSSDWCLYGAKDGFHRADIANGSYEQIADAWGYRVRTDAEGGRGYGFQETGHYDNNVKEWL